MGTAGRQLTQQGVGKASEQGVTQARYVAEAERWEGVAHTWLNLTFGVAFRGTSPNNLHNPKQQGLGKAGGNMSSLYMTNLAPYDKFTCYAVF